MPRYEFVCPKCKQAIELERSINDETTPLCCSEGCGGIEMEQIISRTSFALRGGGWADSGYSKDRQ